MSAKSMCGISYTQGHELISALVRAGFTSDHAQRVITSRGNKMAEAMFAIVQGEVQLESPPEPVLDFIVRVDRSVKPTYPDWMKKVIHPELELAGPAEYDLQTRVEQWFHDDQKNGIVVGNTIYKYLKDTNALTSCLNLQDGLAIREKDIAVFRKLFRGKAVFLWGSVVRDCNGDLDVPYLCEDGGEVVVYWYWLDDRWNSRHPALRFGK